MTEQRSELMTRDELAEVARVHRRTLDNWAALGVGPRPIRHGPRLIRYRRGEVDAWLAVGDGPGFVPAASRDGPEAA
jgi:predicted DNA-binding transcriptional regulator AlpA